METKISQLLVCWRNSTQNQEAASVSEIWRGSRLNILNCLPLFCKLFKTFERVLPECFESQLNGYYLREVCQFGKFPLYWCYIWKAVWRKQPSLIILMMFAFVQFQMPNILCWYSFKWSVLEYLKSSQCFVYARKAVAILGQTGKCPICFSHCLTSLSSPLTQSHPGQACKTLDCCRVWVRWVGEWCRG